MSRLLLAAPVAWIAGCATYFLALQIIWGQSLSPGDASAAFIGSFVVLVVAVPFVYWPVLALLSHVLGGHQPQGAFVGVAVMVGVIPMAIILLRWGGGLSMLVSSEAQLFYCMFAAVGTVLGIAFSCNRETTE